MQKNGYDSLHSIAGPYQKYPSRFYRSPPLSLGFTCRNDMIDGSVPFSHHVSRKTRHTGKAGTVIRSCKLRNRSRGLAQSGKGRYEPRDRNLPAVRLVASISEEFGPETSVSSQSHASSKIPSPRLSHLSTVGTFGPLALCVTGVQY